MPEATGDRPSQQPGAPRPGGERPADDGTSVAVRVLSYNVRSLRDDRAALARVVRACAPDVLLVQEAPRFFRWRKAAARLARETGLYHVTGGATACGPMVLADLGAHVEHTEDVLLPRTPGLHRRGLATAVLRVRGARLGVASFHLSLAAAERRSQARSLLGHLERWRTEGVPAGVRRPGATVPVQHAVVGGDVNEGPAGRAFRSLAEDLTDAWAAKQWGGEHTNPAAAPRQRIDAVFTTPDVEVLACGVPREVPGVREADLRAASDHLPVLADLRVPMG
ncbi:endonuclease/exonuclease/phosphatase family protein [Streptomyces sp. NPDC059740]|uniref:endonuclease/exonuclease/phosphatase family protein n=1 Tax=Streptomyces sp. NPDC059740 TaxID=3346926 RepID=UPI0036524DAC